MLRDGQVDLFAAKCDQFFGDGYGVHVGRVGLSAERADVVVQVGAQVLGISNSM